MMDGMTVMKMATNGRMLGENVRRKTSKEKVSAITFATHDL